MMWAIVLMQVTVMFFCTSMLNALSLDFSALRSGENKQLQAQVKHVRTYTTRRLEIGGKFAKVEGRNKTYEVYIAQSSSVWKAIVVESDARRYHSHNTFALGTGLGYKGFSATGGARVEYKSTRNTFARGALKYVRKWKWVNLTGHLEGLSDGNNERIDHKLEVKIPHKHIYVAFRTERVRSVSTDIISFGVTF
jgi:hypothetical protein